MWIQTGSGANRKVMNEWVRACLRTIGLAQVPCRVEQRMRRVALFRPNRKVVDECVRRFGRLRILAQIPGRCEQRVRLAPFAMPACSKMPKREIIGIAQVRIGLPIIDRVEEYMRRAARAVTMR